MSELLLKKKRLSLALGHNREHILNAYIGSLNWQAVMASARRCKENVLKANEILGNFNIPNVEPAYLADCIEMQRIIFDLDLDIAVEKIQFLWRMHSRRHGVEWMSPSHAIATALEAAAISVTKTNFHYK